MNHEFDSLQSDSDYLNQRKLRRAKKVIQFLNVEIFVKF